ncbi:MAG: hypothetical protein QOE64_1217 [Frankiales bacterium]|jgi:hypothetical protein|nr:hypothetical protein [Frankiales bacterium]
MTCFAEKWDARRACPLPPQGGGPGVLLVRGARSGQSRRALESPDQPSVNPVKTAQVHLMRVRLFDRLPRPATAEAETAAAGWTLPATRTCRGVQLVHVGQVCTCINDTCPDPSGPHVVSFRCIVMSNPCPTCGAQAWGHDTAR